MRSSWCSYDTVRLRTTWNNFSFSAQHTTLAQHTTWKEMFEKVDILRWETSAFADTLRVCCADGASAMIRTKKALWIYEKVEQKYLGSYCFLRREKIRQRRNLRSGSLNIFHLLLVTSKVVPYAFLMWCFVWRDGGRTQWAFVPFDNPLAQVERCWREWST